ncbi:NADPH-dependent FMN reductase [Sinomicrobium weinanense]|uniref:NAD(P)H-dependent oxidoreductase n=1 Tax=Sinomicrobium weinanense TaxID=2842200 RepID=A0A926JUN5_9FLAO|nr:NAD(P)H-dependent oxidoreductase [Sinomicrobium weinanense]MBC9797511.1 NAD(P)H-dependent oxidoreductase [Sinomicrobium weinanense]MBU3122203.1 NAD(P)H-dependent oxidoreductase [Sinomicrobium weinanense]
MASILAFAGSNSSTSINYELVKYTADKIKDIPVQQLNMVNFPFPMYSEDLEKEEGFSDSLVALSDDIKKAEGLVISVNEHNGNPSAYFKNLIDWLSRLDRSFMEGKKVLLMSTSTGRGGGGRSLSKVEATLPVFGAEITATFSLPSFNHTFSREEEEITDNELKEAHQKALDEFLKTL